MANCTNILFVGGCLLNQNNLKRDELFNHVLRDRLVGKYGSDRFSLSFGNYWSYSNLPEKIKIYSQRKSPDIVVLFIRPFPLMPLVKPFVKFGANQGEKRLTPHPALLNRKKKWLPHLDPPPPEATDVFVRKRKFALRDVNLAIGKIVGLERWMHRYLLEIVDLIHQHCEETGAQLFVVSPPDNPESILGSAVCKNTAQVLEKKYSKKSIRLLNINQLSAEYFEEDGVHYNSKGHQKLAFLLEQMIVNNSVK